jgi:hypothetical protein
MLACAIFWNKFHVFFDKLAGVAGDAPAAQSWEGAPEITASIWDALP